MKLTLEFLMLISNWNQSPKAEGKKIVLETVRSTIVRQKIVISCPDDCFTFWNKIN